jgi:hypothetical protein
LRQLDVPVEVARSLFDVPCPRAACSRGPPRRGGTVPVASRGELARETRVETLLPFSADDGQR